MDWLGCSFLGAGVKIQMVGWGRGVNPDAVNFLVAVFLFLHSVSCCNVREVFFYILIYLSIEIYWHIT